MLINKSECHITKDTLAFASGEQVCSFIKYIVNSSCMLPHVEYAFMVQ